MSRDSKPRKARRAWRLVPLFLTAPIADVMRDAIERSGYAEHSWRHCPPDEVVPKYGDALLRHLEKYQAGEWLDSDSGKPHLAHAGANVLILLWHGLRDERARPEAW